MVRLGGAGLGQHLGEAFGRVIADTVALSLAPVEDDAETLEDAPRGLGTFEPLRAVLCVSEPGLVTGVDLTCGLLEGGHGPLLVSTLGEGVAARASDPTQPSRPARWDVAGTKNGGEGDRR